MRRGYDYVVMSGWVDQQYAPRVHSVSDNLRADLLENSSCEGKGKLATRRRTELFLRSLKSQLVKKLPVFYGNRKFITVFTRARHWILLQESEPHFVHSHHICLDCFNITFPSAPRSSNYFFTWRYPTKLLYVLLTAPCMLHVLPISTFLIYLPINIGRKVQNMQFSWPFRFLSDPIALCSQTLSFFVLLLGW
jgi:hypothetical protein